jgi:hypothetical protein
MRNIASMGRALTPINGSAAAFGAARRGTAGPPPKLLTLFLFRIIFLFIPPRTEGCLISVSRRGAGSGGRGMTCIGDAVQGPAVQAASSRRANRASPGPTGGGSRHGQKCWAPFGPTAVDRRPSNSRGEAGRLKRDVHRGRGGANLKHRARDALGWADLRLYGLRQASMSRGVEARGSEHFSLRTLRRLMCAPDPWRPARPRFIRAGGKWTAAYPGP